MDKRLTHRCGIESKNFEHSALDDFVGEQCLLDPEAKGSQRHSKGRQREPKASQRETREKGRQEGRAGKGAISTNSRSTAKRRFTCSSLGGLGWLVPNNAPALRMAFAVLDGLSEGHSASIPPPYRPRITSWNIAGLDTLRTFWGGVLLLEHMFIEHSSNICSRTCQSTILLHANITNMANIPRTWFRTLRTYVHSNTCSRTCQIMHFANDILKPNRYGIEAAIYLPENQLRQGKVMKIIWNQWKSRRIQEIHEHPGKSMKMHENPWKSMKIYKNVWKSMTSTKTIPIKWGLRSPHCQKTNWEDEDEDESNYNANSEDEDEDEFNWNSKTKTKIYGNPWKTMQIHGNL